MVKQRVSGNKSVTRWIPDSDAGKHLQSRFKLPTANGSGCCTEFCDLLKNATPGGFLHILCNMHKFEVRPEVVHVRKHAQAFNVNDCIVIHHSEWVHSFCDTGRTLSG